jgi:signal transduction histidine kinase
MRSTYSIRRRLAGFAVIVVVGAMLLTGVGLTKLFQRHIERRVGQELDAHLEQIVGGLRFEQDGSVKLSRPLSDPRFGKVFGGLYYQVTSEAGAVILKSRSLWDMELDLPDDEMKPGEVHIHHRAGPNQSQLLLHEGRVVFTRDGGDQTLLVIVGIDKAEILALRAGFSNDLIPALGFLALVLLAGFALQISLGIRPMAALRQQVVDVRSGKTGRLAGDAPSEVMPLVDEVNSLLDLQDQNMIRARDRAADLAHGLKTPLTALGSDIAKLRAMGATGIADDIQELSTRMRRHLDRELALARDRHGRARAQTGPKAALDSILRTLEKTPDGERLQFQNNVPAELLLAIDQVDFLEVAGNLLENASRFATNAIVLDAAVRDGFAAIIINDDGPGVSEAEIARVTVRGVRLDSSAQGSGLGLAIAKDILEAYGGRFDLENRDDGGLAAIITLPIATSKNTEESA